MNLAPQAISFPPMGFPVASKALPLARLESAFSLQPNIAVEAADQVLMSPSGLSHLTQALSPKGLNPLSGLPNHSENELKQVSKNFEAIFMQMLFKEMRNSVQKTNLFGNSQGMEFFESMYDDQLSQQLASTGGLGIGRMVYQKLKTVTAPHQKLFS